MKHFLRPGSVAPISRLYVTIAAVLLGLGCQGGSSGQSSEAALGSTSDGASAAGSVSSSLTNGTLTSSTSGGVVGVGGGTATSGAGATNGVGGGATSSLTNGVVTNATGGTVTGTATTSSVGCPTGAVQCPDRCANLNIDFYNCGACGTACVDGQTCVGGVCECGVGTVDCGSGCIDLNVSLEHCGACGNVCPVDTVCSGGVCGTGCLPEYTKCTEGCRDTTNDAQNCGACGTACAATQVCRNGQCGCGSTQLLCDGVCLDVSADTQNCGACNNVCQSGQWCADGFCLDDSTLDCGGTPKDNSCANYTRNVYNMYYLFNNLWGAEENGVSGEQCIWNTCIAGDLIGWGTDFNWPQTSGVKSYTSVILGWHWGWLVPPEKTILPVRLDSGSTVTCGWNFEVNATGDFTVAYDLWTHTLENPAQEPPGEEIMIWLYKTGNVGPVGSLQATVSIGGATWDLYGGPGGATWNVYSYVRTANTTNAVLNITDFTNDLIQRGWTQGSKYLVSVEAGPEVSGGSGSLDTHGFYCRKR